MHVYTYLQCVDIILQRQHSRLTAAFRSKIIVEFPNMPRPAPEVGVNVLAPVVVSIKTQDVCNTSNTVFVLSRGMYLVVDVIPYSYLAVG